MRRYSALAGCSVLFDRDHRSPFITPYCLRPTRTPVTFKVGRMIEKTLWTFQWIIALQRWANYGAACASQSAIDAIVRQNRGIRLWGYTWCNAARGFQLK